MDEHTETRLREVIEAIPPGDVRSYGEVAALAGVPSARLVGRFLAESHGLPWHRVVHADGTFAPHLAMRQARLLQAEGVRVEQGRIVTGQRRVHRRRTTGQPLGASRSQSPRRRLGGKPARGDDADEFDGPVR